MLRPDALIMNWIELVAAALGIVSVWYARKENILVFPFGIANVLIYIYICYEANMYANAGINGFYLLSNIYGWYNWTKTDAGSCKLQISRNSSSQNFLACIGVIALYAGVLCILLRTNTYEKTYLPYIDAFNISFFLIATILMAFKKLENWVFWMVGNIVSIPIFASQGLYFTALQYTVFLVLSALGWKEWRKKIEKRH